MRSQSLQGSRWTEFATYVTEQELFTKNHGGQINFRQSMRLAIVRLRLKAGYRAATLSAATARIRLRNAQSALRRSVLVSLEVTKKFSCRSRSENSVKQAQEELKFHMRDCRRSVEKHLKLSEMIRRKLQQLELQQTSLSGSRKMEKKICAAISKGMEIENFTMTVQRNSQYSDLNTCGPPFLKAGDRIRLGNLPTVFYIRNRDGSLYSWLRRAWHTLADKFLSQGSVTDAREPDAYFTQQVG